MWLIIKNEWRYLAKGKVLSTVSIAFTLLLLISVLLGILQVQTQKERYTQAQEHLREQWESIEEMHPHGAAHYGTYVFKPSNLLSGLDEGVNSVTGNVLRVEGHVQNEMMHSESSQMPIVSKFGKLKGSLLLQFFVPLLLIFLAFQAIHNEKNSGRLKLLLIQGKNPINVVIGKTLAIWIYGLFLLFLCVFIYTIINSASLSLDNLFRTAFFFFAYSLYYFIVTALTVYLSIRIRNTNLALTSMLGVWIIWTIFLPSIMMSSIENAHRLPSREEFKTAMREDRSKGLDGHNPSDKRRKDLEAKFLADYEVDSLDQLPINFDGIVMQEDEEYGNQVWDKHFGELSNILMQQKESYQLGGIINPFISLQNSSMGFAASDNYHHQDFMVQVENYRRVFVKTLNDEHAYGGSKTGDWSVKADNDFFKSVADFEYQPTSILQTVFRYSTDIVLLALWSSILVIGLTLGSKKMKVL